MNLHEELEKFSRKDQYGGYWIVSNDEMTEYHLLDRTGYVLVQVDCISVIYKLVGDNYVPYWFEADKNGNSAVFEGGIRKTPFKYERMTMSNYFNQDGFLRVDREEDKDIFLGDDFQEYIKEGDRYILRNGKDETEILKKYIKIKEEIKLKQKEIYELNNELENVKQDVLKIME